MISPSRMQWAERFTLISSFLLLALWPVLTFSTALTDIFLWSSFIFCILSLLFAKKWPALPDRVSLIFLTLFVCFVLISMTVSDYPKQSFRGLVKVLRQLTVFLLVFHMFRVSSIKNKFRVVVLLSFILLTVDGFFQYFVGFDFIRGFIPQESSAGLRVSASFEQYGKLAAYLCIVLPVIIGRAISAFKQRSSSIQIGAWTLLSILGVLLLVLTRSRGAFLALSVGCTLILIFRKNWKTLGLLILVGAIFITALPRSMIIHLDSQNKEQSLVERVELWHRALDVVLARPFTGTGVNTYAVAHQQFDTRKSWRVQNYYAHNGYLQMGAEIGLPGLVFFVFFLLRWAWIHRPWFSDTDAETDVRWGLLGGIISFMVFCLADTAMHSLLPIITFFFAVGLLGALNPHQQRTHSGA